jgi:formate--tetrahydrofolate ligase
MSLNNGCQLGVPSDYEIAQSVEKAPIADIVEPLGLDQSDLRLQGKYKAKIKLDTVNRLLQQEDTGSKLVLVTGMTPTPKGEGKTVTTVGLGQSFNQLGRDALIALREPSVGPVFGVKGGAAGGGYSQVLPMEDINPHFTGDIHALTAAHNLIATMLDAHVSHGNENEIDVTNVKWKRAIDMNDRALRETVVGLGGETSGQPREDGFVLTAASELMAVLCLADGLGDLKERISRIIVAYDNDGNPVTVDDIEATDGATILLKEALEPNVVQTVEGVPALVHGGPFANIAHGTNSLLANKIASRLSEYLITEAGFGSDLGAEKFNDIVCRFGGMEPDAATLVVSVRALKYYGKDMWPAEYDTLSEPDVMAVERGFPNLDKHIENLQKFGLPVVVAVNRFPDDTDREIQAVIDHCENRDVRAAESTVFRNGGEGGLELTEKIIEATESESTFKPLYDTSNSIKSKIETVAAEMYGADGVTYRGDAEDDIARLERLGLDDMPVYISKTFHSLSDTVNLKGDSDNWELDITEVYASAGAGFLVVLTGDVLTLPGLPEHPAAADMEIDKNGKIDRLL